VPGVGGSRRYASEVQLGILFWFYKDAVVCRNRLRLLRRRNPGVPIYGLYGGPVADAAAFASDLGPLLDDFWAYPGPEDPEWKYRNGDLVISAWFADRGRDLAWDSVFVAQWDMVAVTSVADLVGPIGADEMLLSGLRPVREVEAWWHWMRGHHRDEFEQFMAKVQAEYGEVADPLCCQFIGVVAPRSFLERYCEIAPPELGFLEYKVPVYAQVLGTPLVADTCFRPWWAEEPATSHVPRTERLVHAWPTSVRLPVMYREVMRPHGRRVFHPYHGIFPHDLASLGEATSRAWRR
jgi:hypothetical protein